MKKKKKGEKEGKGDERGIVAQDSYPEENQAIGPGLFEARQRSSSQPIVCTVKVACIDRTVGLSFTSSIDDDYFRHRISVLTKTAQ